MDMNRLGASNLPAADIPGGQPSTLDLLRAFRDGRLRPDEVAEDALRRIEHQNPQVNAYVTVDPRQVRAAAAESTERYRHGTARPLEGVPVAVKDLIDTAGLRTTYGSAIFRDYVPAADAVVVAALRQAGAVVLGKTATHEFAWGITTDGKAYGPTRNPWNPSRTAGGSSGGSGAALAAGMAGVALGTDTVGSVRIPAAFCGVVGFKPTFGILDRAGVFPLAPSLDHVGLLARSVADVRLLWSVLAPSAPPATPPASTRLALGSIRVGVWQPAEDGPGQVAVTRLCDLLRVIGLAAEPVSAPDVDALALTGAIVGYQGLRVHTEAGLWPGRRRDYEPDVAARLAAAESISAEQYAAAQLARGELRQQLRETFTAVDLLLSPVSLTQPAPLQDRDPATIASFRRRVMSQTAIADLIGAPSIALPVGLDLDGLPLGAQLMAAPRRDTLLLDLAEQVLPTS